MAALTNPAALVVLLAVILLGLPAVGAAPTASACSCAAESTTLSSPRRPGEVLFEGRVLGRRDVADLETVWTLQVARVLRGEVTAVQPVVAPSVESSCGLQLTVGESYLISATPDPRPGVLGTGLCTATQQTATMTSEERRTLEQFFGPGRPPRAAPPAPVSELPRDPDPLTALTVGAVLMAGLVAAVGALLLSRRRRRTTRSDAR